MKAVDAALSQEATTEADILHPARIKVATGMAMIKKGFYTRPTEAVHWVGDAVSSQDSGGLIRDKTVMLLVPAALYAHLTLTSSETDGETGQQPGALLRQSCLARCGSVSVNLLEEVAARASYLGQSSKSTYSKLERPLAAVTLTVGALLLLLRCRHPSLGAGAEGRASVTAKEVAFVAPFLPVLGRILGNMHHLSTAAITAVLSALQLCLPQQLVVKRSSDHPPAASGLLPGQSATSPVAAADQAPALAPSTAGQMDQLDDEYGTLEVDFAALDAIEAEHKEGSGPESNWLELSQMFTEHVLGPLRHCIDQRWTAARNSSSSSGIIAGVGVGDESFHRWVDVSIIQLQCSLVLLLYKGGGNWQQQRNHIVDLHRAQRQHSLLDPEHKLLPAAFFARVLSLEEATRSNFPDELVQGVEWEVRQIWLSAAVDPLTLNLAGDGTAGASQHSGMSFDITNKPKPKGIANLLSSDLESFTHSIKLDPFQEIRLQAVRSSTAAASSSAKHPLAGRMDKLQVVCSFLARQWANAKSCAMTGVGEERLRGCFTKQKVEETLHRSVKAAIRCMKEHSSKRETLEAASLRLGFSYSFMAMLLRGCPEALRASSALTDCVDSFFDGLNLSAEVSAAAGSSFIDITRRRLALLHIPDLVFCISHLPFSQPPVCSWVEKLQKASLSGTGATSQQVRDAFARGLVQLSAKSMQSCLNEVLKAQAPGCFEGNHSSPPSESHGDEIIIDTAGAEKLSRFLKHVIYTNLKVPHYILGRGRSGPASSSMRLQLVISLAHALESNSPCVRDPQASISTLSALCIPLYALAKGCLMGDHSMCHYTDAAQAVVAAAALMRGLIKAGATRETSPILAAAASCTGLMLAVSLETLVANGSTSTQLITSMETSEKILLDVAQRRSFDTPSLPDAGDGGKAGEGIRALVTAAQSFCEAMARGSTQLGPIAAASRAKLEASATAALAQLN
ncbi:unnamed protein product [Chrysoparadoxa australica]